MLLPIVAFLIANRPAAPADSLVQGFQHPPASAKPHTWWHWMDGNVTKEGITADLEAMKQVGIGGAQMFTVDQAIPHGKVDYNSQQWREMTAFAVKEASRLGIELCIHNCAGWSSSGGPWITPENAMQVIAWSESKAYGPTHYSSQLPPIKAPQVYSSVPYSKDIAVYAFQTSTDSDALRKDPNFLGKTGVVRGDGLMPDVTRENPAIKGVIDLTGKMDAEGKLTWDVPDGEWTILRVGHVPTGKDNHPAPPEGDGLEVDKLSREALDTHWAGMMAKVIKECGPLAGKVLNNALIDSYEVGSQNWTPKMAAEFKQRRGYDMMPFLPAIAGFTVGSRDKTERFLWDLRRTIADLYTDNYYRYFGSLCHKAGMKFSTEPYGNGGFDNIEAGGTADIPMGEFWVGGGTLETTKLAASVGHVYGLPVVGAESFTADEGRGKWLEEPYVAKALGDLVWTNGINRYIFHRYAMQPWLNFKPGMTMGPWGSHLERTQTWWTEAASWMQYIARCQYLLQKGKFVADALYYYGESAPADLPYRPYLKPAIPNGYDYDGCDANTILHRVKVQNGRLVLPDGMSYRVLVLPESTFMTPEMVAKVTQLVREGATVVGPRPTTSPSLVGYPQADAHVSALADALWGPIDTADTATAPGSRKVGKGAIYWRTPLAKVFQNVALKPDFEFVGRTGRSKLVDIHRRIGNAEVYFVSNQEYRSTLTDVTFRVSGLQPELWHGDTGVVENAPVYKAVNGRTQLTLNLGPAESVFVVFRRPAAAPHLATFAPITGKEAVATKVPVITIKAARYETEDGRGADVADTIRNLVKEGQFEIAASNSNFGDPVVDVVKHLHVEYTVDGKSFKQDIPENGTLTLQATGNYVPAADYDLKVTPRGVELTPWEAARFTGGIKAPAPLSVPIDGSWHVAFAKNWGAPDSIDLAKLMSWSEHSNPGVKYFSGSAVYSKAFTVPASAVASNRTLRLELGKVKNFATVTLNGKDLGIRWKEPFAYDVTGVIKAGRNDLQVKITNLWPNRIIGDEQLPPDVEWNGTSLKAWPEWLTKGLPRPKTGRYTFTTWHYWNKDSKLLESGLLGPVVIKSAARMRVK